MAQTRPISYPIPLTPAELAVLLSFTGVQTLLGLESKGLFPANDAAWDKLFPQGRAELERDGWLAHNPDTGEYNLDEQIGFITAVMAAPRYVLVTTLEWPGQARQGITHYLAAGTIEAAFDGRNYHITRLSSPGVMLERLANVMRLPAQPPDWDEFELSTAQARAAAGDPRPEALRQQGVPEDSATALAQALQRGRPRAGIDILPVHYGQVEGPRRLHVFYVDPFDATGGERPAWLAVPADGERVRFIPATIGNLAAAVQAFVSDRAGVSPG